MTRRHRSRGGRRGINHHNLLPVRSSPSISSNPPVGGTRFPTRRGRRASGGRRPVPRRRVFPRPHRGSRDLRRRHRPQPRRCPDHPCRGHPCRGHPCRDRRHLALLDHRSRGYLLPARGSLLLPLGNGDHRHRHPLRGHLPPLLKGRSGGHRPDRLRAANGDHRHLHRPHPAVNNHGDHPRDNHPDRLRAANGDHPHLHHPHHRSPLNRNRRSRRRLLRPRSLDSPCLRRTREPVFSGVLTLAPTNRRTRTPLRTVVRQ